MSTYGTQALVLKRANYSEADRLVTLLTEKHGRITAIARGVRKPLSKLRGFLETFTYGNYRLVEGKTFDTIVEVTPIDYFENIREDTNRQTLAWGLVEIILVTLEDREPHRGLLEWAVGWMQAVDKILNPKSQNPNNFLNSNIQFPKLLFYTAMLTQYFSFIGHAPNLGECGVCRQPIQPEELGWSPGSGGFVHYQCGQTLSDIRKLEPSSGKLIRFLANNNPEAIQKLQADSSLIQKTADLMDDFFRYQIGRELRLRV